MLYILFAFHDDNPRFLDGIEMVVTQQQLVSPLLILKSKPELYSSAHNTRFFIYCIEFACLHRLRWGVRQIG
jgi:hypothetical protein